MSDDELPEEKIEFADAATNTDPIPEIHPTVTDVLVFAKDKTKKPAAKKPAKKKSANKKPAKKSANKYSIGQIVKTAEAVKGHNIWVKITKLGRKYAEGTLMNKPIDSRKKYGDKVKFPIDSITEVNKTK